MTVNMQTCLDLSSAVYGDELESRIPGGWAQINLGTIESPLYYDRHTFSGFVGAAYQNNVTGEIVISFRGTERQGLGDYNGALPISAEDLANDLQIVSGIVPSQFNDAWTFYQSIKEANPNANITITGHSLGGGLAQLVAAKALAEYSVVNTTYTFNAPGTQALVEKVGGSVNLNYSYINNYSAMNDWCGMFREHIGNLYTIQPIELEHSSNPATQIFNLFTNSHEGILNYNEKDFGKITNKPIGFNQSEGLSLWYYDANNILREGTAPGEFTAILAAIVGKVSESALQNAIKIINKAIDNKEIELVNKLHYSTTTATILSAMQKTVELTVSNSLLSALASDDKIWGNEGDDVITAGSGDDFLDGGTGTNTLKGGSGSDFYVISEGTNTITDSDKKGYVTLSSSDKYIVLTGGNTEVNDGLYTDNQGNQYSWDGNSGSTLTITTNTGATTVINNFSNGNLNLTFPDKPKENPCDGLLNGIQDLFNQAEATAPVQIDPLLIDLDGDGIETTVVSDGVFFDHDKNGYAQESAWAGADDGVLVFDKNANGTIDNGNEIFGDNYVLSNGQTAATGFAALADLDSNSDGVINSSDTNFADIKVMKGDGSLLKLTEAEIASINLSYSTTNTTDANGNTQVRLGSYTTIENETRAIGDYLLDQNAMHSVSTNWVEVSETIAALPDVSGYGTVDSLHQAMAKDTTGTLQTLVESFIAETDLSAKRTILTNLLYKWTGADAISPTSRGTAINAQQLYALEKFMGENFVGVSNATNPNNQAANILNSAYAKLSNYIYAQLESQTALKPLYELITMEYDLTTNSITMKLTQVTEYIQNAIDTNEANGQSLLSDFNASFKMLGLTDNSNYSEFYETFAAMGEDYKFLLDLADKAVIYGTSGDDSLDGTALGEAYILGEGNDTVYSRQGNDIVYGGTGNDYIDSCEGNDIIFGQEGNDTLKGGNGQDTYIFNLGDGQDVIDDFNQIMMPDTIKFGSNISLSDIEFCPEGDNLVLKIKNTTDQITFVNWEKLNNIKNALLKFQDGTTLSLIQGTTGNDNLYFTSNSDFYSFNRGMGQDTLNEFGESYFNQSSIDTIKFGSGITQNDLIFSKLNGSLIININGTNDKLTIPRWTDSINEIKSNFVFADGSVLTKDDIEAMDIPSLVQGTDGDDWLRGTYSDDTIIGGKGNDIINGNGYGSEKGNDTYIFNLGDGQDTLTQFGSPERKDIRRNADTGEWEEYTIPGTSDTIKFGAGITAEDIELSKTNGNLIIKIKDTSDQITINNWVNNIDGISGQLLFDDGTTITKDDIEAMNIPSIVQGTIGNNDLNFTKDNDLYIFNRGDGQDVINNFGSDNKMDTIRFGDGITKDDIDISKLNGKLIVKIKDSTDQLIFNNWAHNSNNITGQFIFEDSTTITKSEIDSIPSIIQGTDGNDWLEGTSSDDTIICGKGNDIINGNGYGYGSEKGNDTYIFNLGDGQDTIQQWGGGTATETIKFGANITKDNLDISKINGNLIIKIKNTNDQITINNFINDNQNISYQILFEDGISIINSELDLIPSIVQGTDGDDQLGGTTEDDTIIGGKGNDYINGYGGYEKGNDTYIFNLGDGQDTLTQFGSPERQDIRINPDTGGWEEYTIPGTSDTIKFGAGITQDNIEFSKANGNLVIKIKNTSDQITINNWVNNIEGISGQFLFDDGTTITKNDIEAMNIPSIVQGTIGNDNLNFTNQNDIYIFNRGDGQDTINQFGSDNKIDTIKFGDGITRDDIDISKINGDLIVKIKETSDQITINDWVRNADSISSQILFDDGTVITKDDIETMAPQNLITGSTSDDWLDSTDGQDIYIFNRGDGKDEIWDFGSNNKLDTVKFGSGINQDDVEFSKVNGNLVVKIKDTTDQITISEWVNRINYISGQFMFDDGTIITKDDIEAMDLPSQIIGTNGNDNLNFTNKNDLYIFNRDDGQDTINQFGSDNKIDTIKFGDGITRDDIDISKINGNLVIKIKDTTDQITINNWVNNIGNISGQFMFDDGTIITKNDIEAMNLPSQIVGTNWEDYLRFTKQNDVYVFSRGCGQDDISMPTESFLDIKLDIDTISFASDISKDDIEFSKINEDLIIKLKNSQDQVRIFGWSNYDQSKIDKFEFADGSVITKEDLASLPSIFNGTTGNDYQNFTNISDTYTFNLGDGQDIISNFGLNNNLDTIEFGIGITQNDIDISKLNGDLIIKIKNANDQIIIKNWATSQDDISGKFVFADGTIITKQDIDTIPSIISKDLYGNIIFTKENDLFVYKKGDGPIQMDESNKQASNIDIIRFDEGILEEDLEFSMLNGDLVIKVKDSTDKITIRRWLDSSQQQIDHFEFAGGSVITKNDIDAMNLPSIFVSEGSNYYSFTPENDLLTFNRGDGPKI